MGKAELGIKRICPSCGTRYYDMNKVPPICPACGTSYDPEALLKSRRVRIPVDYNIRALEPKGRKGKKAAIVDEDAAEEIVLDEEEASELEEYEEDLKELGGDDVEIVEGDDDMIRPRVTGDEDDDLDDDDLTEVSADDLDADLEVDDTDLDEEDLGDINTDDEDDDR